MCDADYSTGKSLALVPRLLTFSPKVYTFCSKHRQHGMIATSFQMTANSWTSILLSPLDLLSHTTLADSTESTQTASAENTSILFMVGCKTRGVTNGLTFKVLSFLVFGVLLEVLCFEIVGNRCFVVTGNFHMTNVSSSLSSCLQNYYANTIQLLPISAYRTVDSVTF